MNKEQALFLFFVLRDTANELGLRLKTDEEVVSAMESIISMEKAGKFKTKEKEKAEIRGLLDTADMTDTTLEEIL